MPYAEWQLLDLDRLLRTNRQTTPAHMGALLIRDGWFIPLAYDV